MKEYKDKEMLVSTSPIYLGQNKMSPTPDHITHKHGTIFTERIKQIFLSEFSKNM
jgi:hypothetical protein